MSHPEALVEKVAQAIHTSRVGAGDVCADEPNPTGSCWDSARAVLGLFDVRVGHQMDPAWIESHVVRTGDALPPEAFTGRIKYNLETAWEEADA